MMREEEEKNWLKMSQNHYLYPIHRSFSFFLRKNGNTSNWIHQDYFLERERENVGKEKM
jgi:hypothetical protein